MVDLNFHTNYGPFALAELLKISGSILLDKHEHIDPNIMIQDVAPLENATGSQVSFFSNAKYIEEFKKTKAGFCITDEKFADIAPLGMVVLISKNPYLSYAKIASAFYPTKTNNQEIYIANSAVIEQNVSIGNNCHIGHGVVIETGAKIGDNCFIGHNTVICKNVIIGDNCYIAPCVTIMYSVIKNDVIIHSGARIGQDGFGYASDHTGHHKVPQLGKVIIGNNVEIGANTTVDRGSGHDTIIGDQCKIDNLVQIGHNVKMGTGCIIVSQVGVSGSTKLGDFVVLGGKVGVAGHLDIGNFAQAAAGSGVIKDVKNKEIVGGYPALPIRQWHRQTVFLKKVIGAKDE
jgi:UDP-3-O-[3-hydroxymyristoyl] glucosamine N-acyltransferase